MFKSNRTNTTARIATLVLAATMLAGAAPASAAQTTYDTKTPALTTLEQSAPVAKFTVSTPAVTAMTTSAVKAAAPVKALVTATTVKPATTTTTATKRAASGSESAQAKAILAGLIGKYPILQGTTVTFGDARGYQAIALYKSGRIVINPAHTASLSRILDHEVWHIIDWRDNGVIDWGENIPAH